MAKEICKSTNDRREEAVTRNSMRHLYLRLTLAGELSLSAVGAKRLSIFHWFFVENNWDVVYVVVVVVKDKNLPVNCQGSLGWWWRDGRSEMNAFGRRPPSV